MNNFTITTAADAIKGLRVGPGPALMTDTLRLSHNPDTHSFFGGTYEGFIVNKGGGRLWKVRTVYRKDKDSFKTTFHGRKDGPDAPSASITWSSSLPDTVIRIPAHPEKDRRAVWVREAFVRPPDVQEHKGGVYRYMFPFSPERMEGMINKGSKDGRAKRRYDHFKWMKNEGRWYLGVASGEFRVSIAVLFQEPAGFRLATVDGYESLLSTDELKLFDLHLALALILCYHERLPPPKGG